MRKNQLKTQEDLKMREKELLEQAFAMPLTSPAYPRGPYRFVNREYLIITYRTDAAKLRAVVPEPLELDEREALVKYEFIRMPDSDGFGDYTESGQVIPVSFRGRKGGYTHCMFLNDEGPIAGGRELWGFPKKLAQPTYRGRHAGRNPRLRAASGRGAVVLRGSIGNGGGDRRVQKGGSSSNR